MLRILLLLLAWVIGQGRGYGRKLLPSVPSFTTTSAPLTNSPCNYCPHAFTSIFASEVSLGRGLAGYVPSVPSCSPTSAPVPDLCCLCSLYRLVLAVGVAGIDPSVPHRSPTSVPLPVLC